MRQGSAIRVCLSGSGVDEATRPSFETTIRDAIIAWVDGARPASTVALLTQSDITFSCTDPHVTVDWSSSTGSAHTGSGSVSLFAGDDFPVVLHEFGHVFGIGDTSVEGGACDPGQPNSVMCGSGGIPSALQPDDLNAIQEVFCMAFESSCNRRWASAMKWCYQSGDRFRTGDFNGDGRSDMLCNNPVSGYVWIAYASSTGRFTGTGWEKHLNWCNTTGSQLTMGDFNGDGRTDMLCHNVSTGSKAIAYANSAGSFTGTNWQSAMGWCRQPDDTFSTADFNGDGRADMHCHNRATGTHWLAYANASGQFPGTSWERRLDWCLGANDRLHLGDFNRDGRTDLLCHNSSTGANSIAYANTSGQFTGPTRQSTEGWCYQSGDVFSLGDFNGDGRTDMLCRNLASGHVQVAFADANGGFLGTSREWAPNWCTQAGTEFLGTGDFDGNGTDDFLCHDRNDGDKWIAYQYP
ncbi:FG-GAP-like repeat-containing protein [Vitiosangium sp. GDMCC 1.1324]|uniref:FG-GAP-like repeat-containing protein n=1 Tax=Vitiosangium sp. (strain GDMCC 1.1324) TaxID=2138576 RepID=UPI00130E2874|nr:FG-GAP-like repeat-containing protein [Vitiosangium sp. GDMCC 1.1324]